MANHVSAEKRDRQRVRRTERNRSIKSAVRTTLKKARVVVGEAGSSAEAVATAVTTAASSLDRAASKGAIHPRAAARTKSRLAKAAARRAQA